MLMLHFSLTVEKKNNMMEKKPDSIFYRLRRAFINPFSTILFVLALISFLTEIITKDTGSLRSVVIILTMLVISGTIRLVQELRSKRHFAGIHANGRELRLFRLRAEPPDCILLPRRFQEGMVYELRNIHKCEVLYHSHGAIGPALRRRYISPATSRAARTSSE